MKKTFMLLAGVSYMLLISACTSVDLTQVSENEAIIFGKLTVIDHKGRDMSDSCDAAAMNVGENNLLVQKVEAGTVSFNAIHCNKGRYQYSIKAAGLTSEAHAGKANYFGDVKVTLSPARTYNVEVKDNFDATKILLPQSNLEAKKSLLKEGGTKSWGRYFKGADKI